MATLKTYAQSRISLMQSMSEIRRDLGVLIWKAAENGVSKEDLLKVIQKIEGSTAQNSLDNLEQMELNERKDLN